MIRRERECEMRITIEKVERLMDRADVGYEVAKEALEAADGDLLEAIIALEKDGKFGPNAGRGRQASYTTSTTSVSGDPSSVGQSYGSPMLPQAHVEPNFVFSGGKAGKTRKTGKAGKTEEPKTGAQGGQQGQTYGQPGGEYGQDGDAYGQYGSYSQPGGPYGQQGSYGQPGGPYKYKDETTDFEDNMKRFGNFMARVFRASLTNYFEVWRKGDRQFYFPVILFLFCLIPWVFWVTLALVIIGLFAGCRYRFSGPHLGGKNANDTMDKAADFAEEVKNGEGPDN